MPMYTFVCDRCKINEEVVRPMADSDKPWVCKCKRPMRRNFAADLFTAGNRDYGRPIVSDALAMGKDQIEEHKRLYPDIRVTDEGQPVFDNFAKHEAYLKATGFNKLPQSTKSGSMRTTRHYSSRNTGRKPTVSK